MHDIFIAVIVGIVEGVTEFLPVSSTGHMILVEDLLGFHGESASVFTVFIQLGAILSVAFLYREKYLKLMQPKNWFQKPAGLSIWHVAAGIVPVGLIGFLAHGMIKRHLFSSFTVIIGLVLAVLELLAPGYVFLGIAIACGLAGLVLLAGVTAPSLPVLLLIVAVLSGVVWLILRRLMGVREGQVRIWDRDINDD